MKRMLLYIVVISLSFLAPLNKVDVATLAPVEAISICKSNGVIIIETDTGEYGEGTSINDALNELKANSLNKVYLDTTKYLLVHDNAVDLIVFLRTQLKGTVKLCMWRGECNLKDVIKYLSSKNLIGRSARVLLFLYH